MKKKYYLVLDTETATLPFADSLCKSASEKQKIAIAKPLIYDIGWIVMDRKGEIIRKENFLVQETFFVPQVFNTAYYKDKRPIYMELLERGEIKTACWNDIIDVLSLDLAFCDIASAYNACFDFKKAIPFTENYIYHLYSIDFTEWETSQKQKCKQILKGSDDSKNPEYLNPYFNLRGTQYPIVDLWGVACEKLINSNRYKEYCLKNSLLTTSAQYFKTSAETAFQYLLKQYDFVEDHTALSDAIIEGQILAKALKKGKVEPKIEAFPFRALGTTFDYVSKENKYADNVRRTLYEYIESNGGFDIAEDKGSPTGKRNHWKRMIKIYNNI